MVVLAHRLGSVVGHELFDVPLFVTTGCPLGLPAVMRNLMPPWRGGGKRPGPELGGTPVPWMNAFDVQDFVALVHR